MAVSKDVGQVSGLYIGTTAPSNRTLIWYDSTPAICAHKVYNQALSAWVMLDNNVISNITYSELVGIASGTGLAQGAWYKITDRGNILALAITSTKIQYVDLNGNFIIDDLVASAIYVVNSNNLYIDDFQGVWDAVNNRLKFDFTAVTPDAESGDDFVYGRRERNGISTLIKYTMQSLVSLVSGNSISWNQGFYFNFLSQLASQMDVAGGVVSTEQFNLTISGLNASYDSLAQSVNDMYDDIQSMVQSLTTATEIYGKQFPYALIPATAAPILTGDTLANIVQKAQRWFDQLRFSNGIDIGPNFSPAATISSINSADNVFEAFQKVQKSLNYHNSLIEDLGLHFNELVNSFAYTKAFNVFLSGANQPASLQVGAVVCGNGRVYVVNSYRNFVSQGTHGNVYGAISPMNPFRLSGNNSSNVCGVFRRPELGTFNVQILIRTEENVVNHNFNYELYSAEYNGKSILPYLSGSSATGTANLVGCVLDFHFNGIPDGVGPNVDAGLFIGLNVTIN